MRYPAFVERSHVACTQPAVLQRRGGRLGVVPVARHHDVTAAHDLTDLTDGGRRTVVAQHRDIHPGPGVSDRSEDRVVRVDVVGAPQPRDRHRRFALAVELHEDRTERRHRLLQAVDVHRAPAVDHAFADGAGRPVPVCTRRCTMVGRQERAAAGMVIAEIEELARFEAPDSGITCRAPRSTYGGNVEARSRATWARRGAGCSSRPASSKSARCATVIAIRLRCDSIAPLDLTGGSAGVEQPRQRRPGRLCAGWRRRRGGHSALDMSCDDSVSIGIVGHRGERRRRSSATRTPGSPRRRRGSAAISRGCSL